MKTGIKLDDRDLAILKILQEEGRITKAALAERVNLSAAPCWERLKRLEKAGVIVGYEAKLSLSLLSPLTMVLVEVELDSHKTADFERFERAVHDYPEILECWAVGGGIDYVLKVFSKDIDSYQRFIDRMLDADIGLRRYYTYVVTKQVKSESKVPLDALV
ncbi:Lrp/AsnC family transcriptional regulator [Rhodobacteraceae bacterium RKSG542]|uniref:Lrp/AsnC family transcriptional regulator n=1 Tax=Pseudovibrio flavus TaxID=2529854 RepID=UPI0012BBB6A5|nr:Lrp/AsnC family transcriptional regulator [Pseudovibrio flavus]MTI17495.1 Lrp/AsnC family transcriptional regulator [Pseudovibrio flavus]